MVCGENDPVILRKLVSSELERSVLIWNKDHKRFYLPDCDRPPLTVSLRRIIEEAIGSNMTWVYMKVCDNGWLPLPDSVHPVREYQIEAVLCKRDD